MKLTVEHPDSIRTRYNLFVIGTFTLAASVIWIGYSLYDTYSTSTVDPEVQDLLSPLDPSIDIEIINELETRIQPPTDFVITAIGGTGNDQRIITINPSGDIDPAISDPDSEDQTILPEQTIVPDADDQDNQNQGGVDSNQESSTNPELDQQNQ